MCKHAVGGEGARDHAVSSVFHRFYFYKCGINLYTGRTQSVLVDMS